MQLCHENKKKTLDKNVTHLTLTMLCPNGFGHQISHINNLRCPSGFRARNQISHINDLTYIILQSLISCWCPGAHQQETKLMTQIQEKFSLNKIFYLYKIYINYSQCKIHKRKITRNLSHLLEERRISICFLLAGKILEKINGSFGAKIFLGCTEMMGLPCSNK